MRGGSRNAPPARPIPRAQRIEKSLRRIWSLEQARRSTADAPTHLHWTIQAFSEHDQEGLIADSSTIVIRGAKTEEEAIAKAASVMVANFYRVFQVEEICDQIKQEEQNHG